MSIFYNEDHSIQIGDFNTWTDWHLVPTSRPHVVPATPKYSFTDIPAAHGSLDLTEALNHYVKFNQREGTWAFYIDNDIEDDWSLIYSKIANDLGGQKFKVVLMDDPNWYYIGRVDVSDFSTGNDYSQITLSYKLEPFKYSIYSTLEDWLWDPFCFETDRIYDWAEINVVGKTVLTFDWKGQAVTPTITVSGTSNGMNFTFKNGNATSNKVLLNNGTFTTPYLVIKPGTNTIIAEAWKGSFSIGTRDTRL